MWVMNLRQNSKLVLAVLFRLKSKVVEGAWKVIDNTQFISITGNLGDAKSTITHPATTTHGKLSPEAKEAAGIREGLIRVSVGLEDIDDIIRDIRRGLDLI